MVESYKELDIYFKKQAANAVSIFRAQQQFGKNRSKYAKS